MSKDEHVIEFLTGELQIEQHLTILNCFRDGKEKVLTTTNVAAHGIDVEQGTIVVNYNLPIDQMNRPYFATYLHRISRTRKFGKKRRLDINFDVKSRIRTMIQQISEHFGKAINPLQVFETTTRCISHETQ